MWCRKLFPVAGFFIFISGVIGFVVTIIIKDSLADPFFWTDIFVSMWFSGIFLIFLVAERSEDRDTTSDFGPSL